MTITIILLDVLFTFLARGIVAPAAFKLPSTEFVEWARLLEKAVGVDFARHRFPNCTRRLPVAGISMVRMAPAHTIASSP
jgi:hypothetical protein